MYNKRYNLWNIILGMVQFCIIIICLIVLLTGCSFQEPDMASTNINFSGSGVFENDSTDLEGIVVGNSGNLTSITQPSGDVVGTSDSQELTNKILTSMVTKGTWTASGIWQVPAMTLNGDITLANHNFIAGTYDLNVTTSIAGGLNIISTGGSDGGANIKLTHYSASPANNDYNIIRFYSYNDAFIEKQYGYFLLSEIDTANSTENGEYVWALIDNGSMNVAMRLSSDGTLTVDNTYGTFDGYDDAELLRQGISKGDTQLLVEAGILIEKKDEKGKVISGKYMIQFQPLLKLLAGGVYQNRDKIDALEARITELEAKLK